MKIIVTIVSILITNLSFGQNACFTISPNSGCPPLTISVLDCSSGTSTPPVYYYTGVLDNEFESNDTFFTYTEPGSYTIYQKISTPGGNLIDSQIVTIYPVPTPIVEITNCGNNQVYLETQNIGYDYYAINWGDGNNDTLISPSPLDISHPFSNDDTRNISISGIHSSVGCGNDTTITIMPFQNFTPSNIAVLEVINDDSILLNLSGQNQVLYQFSGASTNQTTTTNAIFFDTIGGLNTSTNTYCFEIEALNKCNSSAPVPASKSDKVCSVVLSGISQPGFNEINWDTYTGDNTPAYDLNRNQNLHQTFTSNQKPYKDSSIFCSQEYLYQLETKTSKSNSISNQILILGKSESSPNPVSNVFNTFNNGNKLAISWKSASKIPPQFYTVNSTETTDTFLISNSIERTCYEITFTDSCGNTSQISKETCPIILEVKQNSIFELELNWNDYQAFENGLSEYNIFIYNNEKQPIDNINNDLTTTYIFDVLGEENQIYYFKIEGISNDSLSTFSNEVELTLKNRIMMPNAFTPNGDGENDIFIPKVRFVKEFKFAIYNKWGTNLFTSNDQNEGWDGGNFPSGVYSYLVEVTDYLGETTIENGTVTLIK